MNVKVGDLILSKEVDYRGKKHRNVVGQISNIIYEIDWVNPELDSKQKTKMNMVDVEKGRRNIEYYCNSK